MWWNRQTRRTQNPVRLNEYRFDPGHGYHKILKNKISETTTLKNIEELYIKEMCKEIFKSQDFKLVEISHKDISWKSNYDINDRFHNKKITDQSLIHEYVSAKEKHFDRVPNKIVPKINGGIFQGIVK